MPELDIGASQAEYLEELREALSDECLEGYGAMRPRDALQYLIDRHEATRPADDLVPDARATTDSDDGTDSTAADSTGTTPNESGESLPSADDAAAAMSDATTGAKTVRTDEPAPADVSVTDETTMAGEEQDVEETGGEGANAEISGADVDAETSSADTETPSADTATTDDDTNDTATTDAETGTTGGDAGTTTTTTDPAPSPSGSGSPLRQMMELLEEHDDKWAETESSDGKYVVTLPDGSNEHARTRDDVRALLFKHYR